MTYTSYIEQINNLYDELLVKLENSEEVSLFAYESTLHTIACKARRDLDLESHEIKNVCTVVVITYCNIHNESYIDIKPLLDSFIERIKHYNDLVVPNPYVTLSHEVFTVLDTIFELTNVERQFFTVNQSLIPIAMTDEELTLVDYISGLEMTIPRLH